MIPFRSMRPLHLGLVLDFKCYYYYYYYYYNFVKRLGCTKGQAFQQASCLRLNYMSNSEEIIVKLCLAGSRSVSQLLENSA